LSGWFVHSEVGPLPKLVHPEVGSFPSCLVGALAPTRWFIGSRLAELQSCSVLLHIMHTWCSRRSEESDKVRNIKSRRCLIKLFSIVLHPVTLDSTMPPLHGSMR